MTALGAFTFVLHSHLPYVRLAGRWPHGEEWIHEAATETYLPLLETLYDLKAEGIPFAFTLGITPTLAEQLADPDVLAHLDQYLDQRIAAAAQDMTYFEQPETMNAQLRFLAEYFKNEYVRVKTALNERFDRDIVGAFRRLQDEGLIEIMTCAATHAYLPLLGRDSSIQAQIKQGMRTTTRLFGRTPTAIWLPECAYRPAYITDTGRKRPGLEYFLALNDLQVFFSETHTITGGMPVGVATGDVVGPYGAVKRRYVIPASDRPIAPERQATTFQPYSVTDSLNWPEADGSSGVTVIGRNARAGQQVWGALGYPGDFDYREFYRRATTSGLQYWRITGERLDLSQKDEYHPEWAAFKVDQHAEHFAHLIGDQLRRYANESGQYGVAVVSFDTELLGHWWYEGVRWFGKVLRHLASSSEVEMTTAGNYLAAHTPSQTLSLPESSWGAGGGHFSWDNNETRWMWTPIHEAERRMEDLANRFVTATDDERAVLNQAGRELLLLQSSDWPFLITTGQAREYAAQRFNQHLERFDKLAGSLENGRPNTALAAELWELDKVFADIDYRWFCS